MISAHWAPTHAYPTPSSQRNANKQMHLSIVKIESLSLLQWFIVNAFCMGHLSFLLVIYFALYIFPKIHVSKFFPFHLDNLCLLKIPKYCLYHLGQYRTSRFLILQLVSRVIFLFIYIISKKIKFVFYVFNKNYV